MTELWDIALEILFLSFFLIINFLAIRLTGETQD